MCLEGSEIQNVSWDRRQKALRRKARLYLQAMGSPGKHLSRGVTWSDTGLRRVRLASRSSAVKCPPPRPSRHLKAMVSIRPLRPMAPSGLAHSQQCYRAQPWTPPTLAFIPPHLPHLTAKFSLQLFKGPICCGPGPRVRLLSCHVPGLRASLSPDHPAVPYSLSMALCCQGCRHLSPTDSPGHSTLMEEPSLTVSLPQDT